MNNKLPIAKRKTNYITLSKSSSTSSIATSGFFDSKASRKKKIPSNKENNYYKAKSRTPHPVQTELSKIYKEKEDSNFKLLVAMIEKNLLQVGLDGSVDRLRLVKEKTASENNLIKDNIAKLQGRKEQLVIGNQKSIVSNNRMQKEKQKLRGIIEHQKEEIKNQEEEIQNLIKKEAEFCQTKFTIDGRIQKDETKIRKLTNILDNLKEKKKSLVEKHTSNNKNRIEILINIFVLPPRVKNILVLRKPEKDNNKENKYGKTYEIIKRKNILLKNNQISSHSSTTNIHEEYCFNYIISTINNKYETKQTLKDENEYIISEIKNLLCGCINNKDIIVDFLFILYITAISNEKIKFIKELNKKIIDENKELALNEIENPEKSNKSYTSVFYSSEKDKPKIVISVIDIGSQSEIQLIHSILSETNMKKKKASSKVKLIFNVQNNSEVLSYLSKLSIPIPFHSFFIIDITSNEISPEILSLV